MAGQIYPGISTPSLGANLGSALGQGLLGGIQNVIDLRTKKMQQQEAEKAFIDLGYPPEEARGLSKMDTSFQKEYLSQKGKGSALQQSYNFFSRFLRHDDALALASAPTPIQNTALTALINRGAFVPGQSQTTANDMERFGFNQGGGLEALQGIGQNGNFDILQSLTPQLNLLPQNMQDGGLSALQQRTPGNQPGNQLQSQIPRQEKGTLAEILSRPYESSPEKTARLGREQAQQQFLEKQALSEKKFNQSDKELNLKETKEYRDDIEKRYKADKEDRKSRKIARHLNVKGDLQDPLLASILKTVGLDWEALRTADSQIIGAMIEPALKKLKPTFGGNTSNTELITVLQTHWSDPRKSREVREFMLDLADILSEEIDAEYKTYRDIMKKTNDNPPIGLRSIITDKVEPISSAAYDAFENKWLNRFSSPSSGRQATKPYIGLTIDALPNAASAPKGARLKGDDGTIYENTGTSWIKKGKKG